MGQIIDLVRLSQSLDELEARHDSQSPKAFQVGPGQSGRGVELGGFWATPLMLEDFRWCRTR